MVYTVIFAGGVYFLHAFKKKSTSGIGTPKKDIEVSDEPRCTVSSGNVFAGLGLPGAGARLAKAELARTISLTIRERGLTQREAAGLLGIDQPKVSAITRGRLGDFSLERLLTLVGRLGMDIDITVSPMLESSRAPRMVVHRAAESISASDSGHPDRVAFK